MSLSTKIINYLNVSKTTIFPLEYWFMSSWNSFFFLFSRWRYIFHIITDDKFSHDNAFTYIMVFVFFLQNCSVSLVVLDCFIPSFSTMFHQYTLNFYKYMYVSSLIHCHFFWAIMTSCPLNSLGTFLSGMSVLCGSKVRQKDTTKSKVVLVNCWVAFLQLFTTIFLLLGWIWSIVWGTLFISYTGEDFLNNWLMYNFHMPYVLMKLN